MRARPCASRWVNSGRPSRRRVAAATSGSRIRVSPTRKHRRAGRGEAVEIVGAANAALGDDDAVGGHLRRQPFGGAKIDREGLQIAVVDADQPHPEQQGAFQLGLIVNFGQHIEPVFGRGGGQLAGRGVRQRRHDQQHAIGADRDGFRGSGTGRG